MGMDALSQATGRLVATRPGTIVLLTLLLTAGFLTALALIPSLPSSDSFSGSGDAAAAEQRLMEQLPPANFGVPFLASESDDTGGNVLSRDSFDEVLRLTQTLRHDPTLAQYEYVYTNPQLQADISSIWSLPDTLRATMDNETPLTYALGWHEDVGGPGVGYDEATDHQWQEALTRLLDFETPDGTQPFRRQVSADGARVDGQWQATSMFIVPSFDRERVFDVYVQDPSEATEARPHYEDLQFHVQDLLRGNAERTTYIGLGVGVQAEVEREVAASGRLVLVSFVLIGAFLYATLRNARDWAVAYSALPLVIIWMLGAARLVGLSNNQFTAMLPVLILALAVDFAIHGVRRYREERGEHAPVAAVRRSVHLLGPALLLAAGTTSTAFFSNAFSSVEALRDWGIQGGMAIVAALWICGVYAPALRHLWDRRRVRRGKMADAPNRSVASDRVERGTLLGRLAVRSGRHPLAVLLVLALVTIPATLAASQIDSDFDANDFLDDDSELIQGVNRVAEEFPSEGEPAILVVDAELSDPAVVTALRDGFRAYGDMGYRPETAFSLLAIIDLVMRFPEENDATGYVDADGDRIPDRSRDLQQLYSRALRNGVWAHFDLPNITMNQAVGLPPGVPPVPYQPVPGVFPEVPDTQRVLAYSSDTVRELVHPDGRGGYDLTVVYFGIPGTGDFTNIARAQDDLKVAAAGLYGKMDDGSVRSLTLTGEPFKRFEMVNAITASLKVSITISVIVCFLIVLAVFRDPLYAVVTTVPVLVLVAWLFGFMVLIDMSLNLVTVTVAAMAIGVGIDYSIHITERFREETYRNLREPLDALRIAMDSSGVALFGSAITTIAGFLVLMFAPMPLFVTFGLITAAMAAASFLAAATILPPFLVLTERWKRRQRPRTHPRPDAVPVEALPARGRV